MEETLENRSRTGGRNAVRARARRLTVAVAVGVAAGAPGPARAGTADSAGARGEPAGSRRASPTRPCATSPPRSSSGALGVAAAEARARAARLQAPQAKALARPDARGHGLRVHLPRRAWGRRPSWRRSPRSSRGSGSWALKEKAALQRADALGRRRSRPSVSTWSPRRAGSVLRDRLPRRHGPRWFGAIATRSTTTRSSRARATPPGSGIEQAGDQAPGRDHPGRHAASWTSPTAGPRWWRRSTRCATSRQATPVSSPRPPRVRPWDHARP